MDHTSKATGVTGDGTGTGTGTGNGSSEVEVELEAMRKHDFSWHPCKVSLCSTGVGLVIEYLKNGSSEIIVHKEEAMERIRIRSISLEGDGCTLIQQGDHVLAKMRVRRDTLLLDATVDKALSIGHSKKARPRCTFVVKWTYGQVEGETATVPCNAMWKVSTKSISSHPTIIAFFNILGSSSCFSIPPIPNVGEEMKSEFDTIEHGKQIENSSNSADSLKIGNSKNEQFWKDGTVGGFTEFNNPHKKEFFEVKPLPNPIAARAALASMLFKLNHKNSEVSLVQQEEAAEDSKLSKGTNGTTTTPFNSFTNKAHDHSLPTKLGKEKHTTLMKELFPNGNTAKEAHEMNVCRKDIQMPSNRARRLTRSAINELDVKQDAEPKTIARQNGKVTASIDTPKLGGTKRKSFTLNKQEMRSSPRLRSQNKS